MYKIRNTKYIPFYLRRELVAMKLTARDIAVCGMFAALIVVGAFLKIDIPLPLYTMHFTLQWFFVLMAGFLLGARLGAFSVLVYLCIGLVGVPVFAAGGGPAYVLRPGFGFLLGFVLAAFVIGLLAPQKKDAGFWRFLFPALVGEFFYYAVGAVYFYLIKNVYAGTPVSWAVVVAEYCLITVLPDFILCVIASMLSMKLRPQFRKLLER